jgi:hypothetical protein
MHEIIETTESIGVTITSQSAGFNGHRDVEFRCVSTLGTYRQQFEIGECETKMITIPFTLVDGRLEVGYNVDLCADVRAALLQSKAG